MNQSLHCLVRENYIHKAGKKSLSHNKGNLTVLISSYHKSTVINLSLYSN